jgi:DNA-damage-inducible protein D
LIDVERVTAREKLSKSEKKLSGILYERGVDGAGFAIIRSMGDQALFGGFSTNDMKKKLGVPAAKPLADFLPTLTIKAKDFANELTSHNVIEKDLNKQNQISQEHIDNNKAVRDILLQRGVRPETLPPHEDIKKIERRLDKDEKKAAKGSK